MSHLFNVANCRRSKMELLYRKYLCPRNITLALLVQISHATASFRQKKKPSNISAGRMTANTELKEYILCASSCCTKNIY